jgi:hypothetical protein
MGRDVENNHRGRPEKLKVASVQAILFGIFRFLVRECCDPIQKFLVS